MVQTTVHHVPILRNGTQALSAKVVGWHSWIRAGFCISNNSSQTRQIVETKKLHGELQSRSPQEGQQTFGNDWPTKSSIWNGENRMSWFSVSQRNSLYHPFLIAQTVRESNTLRINEHQWVGGGTNRQRNSHKSCKTNSVVKNIHDPIKNVSNLSPHKSQFHTVDAFLPVQPEWRRMSPQNLP